MMRRTWLVLVLSGLVGCAGEPVGPVPQTIDPEPENAVPTLRGQRFFVDEDTLFEGRIEAIDVEDDALQYHLVTPPPSGTLDLSTTGTFRYSPAPDFFGQQPFAVSVSDPFGETLPTIMLLEVLGQPDAPTVQDDALILTLGTSASSILRADDPDGDPLTFTLRTPPAGGSVEIDPDTGAYTYTSDLQSGAGSDRFEVEVDDGVFAVTGRVDVTLTSPNLPVVPSLLSVTLEDTPVMGNLAAPGMTFRLVQPPRRGALVLDVAGTWTYTPNADVNGIDDFTVIGNDGFQDSLPARQTIVVQPVNDAPVLFAPGPLATPADVEVFGTIGAFDAEGDPVFFLVATPPTDGQVDLSPTTGQFGYTPDPGFVGLDTFEVVGSDGNAPSAPVVVEIAVGTP